MKRCKTCGSQHTKEVMFCSRGHVLTTAPADDPLIGCVLDGRYEVRSVLGGGGFGKVYLAVQLKLQDRPCVVKVARPELAGNPQFAARFDREKKALMALRSRNTVQILDHGKTDDGADFIVMEYLEGESLDRMLRRTGALPVELAVQIALRVCESLEEAHQSGVLHRDLKPGNVMVVDLHKSGLIKVIDFGLARLAEGGDGDFRTRTGEMPGTPAYASCEQLLGRTSLVDHRTDIYALGAMLYEMLTGLPPYGDTIKPSGFDSSTLYYLALAKAKAELRPTPPGRLLAAPLDGPLEALVLSMLEASPADRPPSVDAVRTRLEDVARRSSLGSAHAAPPALELASTLFAATPQHGGPARMPSGEAVVRASTAPSDQSTCRDETPAGYARAGMASAAGTPLRDAGAPSQPLPPSAAAVRPTGGGAWKGAVIVLTVLLVLVAVVVGAALSGLLPLPRWGAEPVAVAPAEPSSEAGPTGLPKPAPAEPAAPGPSPAPGLSEPARGPDAGTPETAAGNPVARHDVTLQATMAELPSRTEMSMVEIPAGTYEVGSSEEVVQRLIDICLEGPSESSCAAAMYEDQIPPHTVRLDTFFMDRTEVTNQQFSRCVEAGACRPSRFASSQAYNQPQQPVVGVTVAQAEEFCAWRGGRLPTEAEWEYAARRSHGGAYPWGNESPTPERAAYCDADCVAAEYTVAYTGKKRMAPDPAESHGAGRSVDGLYGLAGNVWEWTADAYDSQFYRRMGGSEAVASPRKDPKSETSQRVIRGGSWKMSPVFLDSRFRRGREPDKSADDVGFRCVAVTLLPGMAEIPGGTFSRGIAEADLPNLVVRCMEDANLKKCSYKTRFGDQIPRHPVTLSAYTIDLFPVTNRMWAECVAKGPCLKSGSTAIDGLNHPDQPVTMVDWDEARTGCESQGKRLCTESEWEVAAIGNQRGALYPWGGTELTPQLANYCSGACAQVPFKDRREDPSLVPGPVLSNPKNVSPWGVFDMAGNVHQWTADHWVESAYRKCRSGCDDPHQPVTGDKDDVVVRGGSFMDGPTKLTSTYRSTRPRHLREKNLGIRCCQSR